MDWKTSESLLIGHAQAEPGRYIRDAKGRMLLCEKIASATRDLPSNIKTVILLSRNSNTHWKVGLGKT